MKFKKLTFLLLLSSFNTIANNTPAEGCDGKVTLILTASQYCEAGERLGFHWEGSSKWVCSSTKNMDAMLMAAFATGTIISVRDNGWETCNSMGSGAKANIIWFKKNN